MPHARDVLMVVTMDRKTPDDFPGCYGPAGNAVLPGMKEYNSQTLLHRRRGAESTAS
jgi:hypothetical protein